MNFKNNFSQMRARQIFAFALMFFFGTGFLVLTVISSAQTDAPVITNATRVVNARDLPKSTVRGRIVYEDTDKPVRRMPFSLALISTSSTLDGGNRAMMNSNMGAYYGNNSGITDANGEFEMRNVIAGKYRLRVDAPNVLNDPDYEGYARANPEAANVPAQIAEEFFAPANSVADVAIRVKRGGVIGGKIVYADGEPATNAHVTIIRKVQPSAAASNAPTMNTTANVSTVGIMSNSMGGGYYGYGGKDVTTDDRGFYRLVGLQPGEYLVRVVERTAHSGDSSGDTYSSYAASFLSWFYPNTNQASKATALRLDFGQELTDIDFTLADRPLFKVAGKIIARGTGQPVPKVKIIVRQKIENKTAEPEHLAAQTREFAADDAGAFDFKDLPTGKYTAAVRFPSSDERRYDEEGKLQTAAATGKLSFLPVEKEFEITSQDLTNFNIELQPAAVISGAVATDGNRPLSNYLSIVFYDEDNKSQLNQYLSPVGGENGEEGKPVERSTVEFMILNVPPGKYGVGVYAHNYSDDGETDKTNISYLKAVRRAGGNLALPFEIKEGESVTDLQLIMGTDGGTLKGVLRDKSGALAVNKQLFAITTDSAKWDNYDYYKYTGTDEKGAFEFKGAPGEYAVILFTDADSARLQKQNRQEVFAWLRERSGNAQKATIRANSTNTVNLTIP